MSTLFVELIEVDGVAPHPNADRLQLARVKGAQCAVGTGYVTTGDRAYYFPPDMLLPIAMAEKLNVTKYLKHAIYPDDFRKTPCRISACRLRGIPSYGFLVKETDLDWIDSKDFQVGDNCNDLFGAVKYEPPVRIFAQNCAPDMPQFHKYTSIEHYWRNADVIPEGTPVRITEKIHGTNSRVGLINIATEGDTEWAFMAGSHNVRITRPAEDSTRGNKYWSVLDDWGILSMLTELCDEKHNVIAFGEIFGHGIQDMDYGQAMHGYRVFDISVNGTYLSWARVRDICTTFHIDWAPLLWEGPFSKEIVDNLTNGPTTLADQNQIASSFKGREGIVITPLDEMFDRRVGRVILKSVSADYLDRKNALDEGENTDE